MDKSLTIKIDVSSAEDDVRLSSYDSAQIKENSTGIKNEYNFLSPSHVHDSEDEKTFISQYIQFSHLLDVDSSLRKSTLTMLNS